MTELEALGMRFGCAGLRLTPLLALPGLTVLGWAPGLIRIVVLLGAAALFTALSPALTLPEAPISYALVLGREFLLGLALAFAVALPAAALAFAGRLADTQSGFSAAQVLNPGLEGEADSLIGNALALSAMVLFVSLDLHVQLLGLLAASLQVLPLGADMQGATSTTLLGAMGLQFTLGLLVVLPVVIAMFAIDVASAYATRSMPQANAYFLALPLKVVAAILILAATLRHLPTLIGRMYEASFDVLPGLLR